MHVIKSNKNNTIITNNNKQNNNNTTNKKKNNNKTTKQQNNNSNNKSQVLTRKASPLYLSHKQITQVACNHGREFQTVETIVLNVPHA